MRLPPWGTDRRTDRARLSPARRRGRGGSGSPRSATGSAVRSHHAHRAGPVGVTDRSQQWPASGTGDRRHRSSVALTRPAPRAARSCVGRLPLCDERPEAIDGGSGIVQQLGKGVLEPGRRPRPDAAGSRARCSPASRRIGRPGTRAARRRGGSCVRAAVRSGGPVLATSAGLLFPPGFAGRIEPAADALTSHGGNRCPGILGDRLKGRHRVRFQGHRHAAGITHTDTHHRGHRGAVVAPDSPLTWGIIKVRAPPARRRPGTSPPGCATSPGPAGAPPGPRISGRTWRAMPPPVSASR